MFIQLHVTNMPKYHNRANNKVLYIQYVSFLYVPEVGSNIWYHSL